MNAAGIALLKEFEGCKLSAYIDLGGVWTIGYGHTGPGVRAGLVWTKERANEQLAADIAERVPAVLAACKIAPNENQLAAMTCLAYNIGLGAFKKSTVLRLHNAGNFTGAANAFTMWNKAGGQVRAGLTRRRAAEMQLYLTPVADEIQTTRALPEAIKDPSTSSVSPATVAAGVGGVLTIAQQAVAQIQQIWDGLSGIGISPHILMSVLGIAAVSTLVYFVYEAWKRRKEGDR